MIYHKPVLVKEVLEYLAPKPGGVYVDATFGGGGHTRAILEHQKECIVIGIDWDTVALEMNGIPLQEEFPERLKLLWANFSQLDMKLKKAGYDKVDGILADFGTSQYQLLERPGFSFHKNTLLDMRMSPGHQRATAEEVINKSSEKKLIEIFRSYGEEPCARIIARKIIEERKKKRIRKTVELAKIVESVVPWKKKGIHPATRIFQALRIFVNRELENIKSFLHASLKVLQPEGRLVCISFHSLEDRIVKDFFKEHATGLDPQLDILTPKVITGSEEEIKENPSSRSAKLRAVQMKKYNRK